MQVKDQIIHLGIAFDSNYLRHFYALFTSILVNNKENKIHIHAIITGVNKIVQASIEKYAVNNGACISFYEIDEPFVKKFVLTGTWSSAVYYRLFFPMLVPQDVNKILYLDTDIIVINDLTPLYAIDLESYPVAAVYDNWVKTAPEIGIHKEGHYFNSGMMLIDTRVWKEQKISEQVFAYLAEFPEKIRFVDQCGLNAVLINNWKKLDFRFNVMRSYIPDVMSKKEESEFLKHKIIIHYTLDRPWKMLCQNPLRHLYHYYLKKSPYKIANTYEDFSYYKIPALLKIRLVELYHKLPLLKSTWRQIKVRWKGESINAV